MPNYRTSGYHAYILRLWEENGRCGLPGVWRCSLENLQTQQRRGFPNLEALFVFLCRVVEEGESEVKVQMENNAENANDAN
jgi:hypothetical protein